jgi:hypothetical protein
MRCPVADEPIVTERGFKRMPPILGAYGGQVEVYESSAADHPHIWVKAVDPGEEDAGTVHLPIEDAERLEGHLRYLRENHYHVKAGLWPPEADHG